MSIPLNESEIERFLLELPGWKCVDEKLVKTYEFEDFREAMEFVIRVFEVADKADHHPEIFNCYNRVELGLNTHDAGGKVTEKDTGLARLIEERSAF